MPNNSEKLGNLGMKLNRGLGFRVGFTFCAPLGVAGDPGGGGGAILLI